jgi:hypothetical protein
MLKNVPARSILISSLLLLLSACSGGTPQPVATPTAVASVQTVIQLSPTTTPQPSATFIPSPTSQPTQTTTRAPTQPPPPSLTPTVPPSARYQSAFGIDYGQPEKYMAQGEQTRFANPSVMGVLLQRKPGMAQVREIFGWLRAEFKASAEGGAAIGISTTEQLLKDRKMTGCHDWALVYSSFARALGYPAVMVDAAGIPWIKQFQGGQKSPYSGHVFTEIFVEGKWILIDSTNGWTVENGYDPANPIIPLKAGFPGETTDLYGFYIMRKGLDSWGYGIHSNAELTRLMEETARQVKLDTLVNPKYTFGSFR